MAKSLSPTTLMTTLVLSVAVLLPIFFLPLTNEMFDTNKRFLFFATTLLALALVGIQVILKKEWRASRTPWDLPILAFGFSAFLTVVLVSPNKVSAFLGSGGLYIAFAVFYFAAVNLIKKNFTDRLITALSIGAIIVTLTTFFDRFGMPINALLNRFFALNIPKETVFFITGSPLFSVFFLGIVTTMLWVRFFQWRAKPQSVIFAFLGFFCTIGLFINAAALLPRMPTHPQFLSLMDSWRIATDVLKTPFNAAFGVGTDSYANAFSIFKPLTLNQTPLWFIRFNNGRNFLLELLTTQGVLGALAWLALVFTCLRHLRTARGEQLPLGVGIFIILLLLFFFPPNILLVTLLCIFLVAWGVNLKQEKIYPLSHSPAPYIVTAALFIAVLTGAYGIARAYAGEYYFFRALRAAATGNGKTTYDWHVRAITTNPYVENYHRSFALTNLSLAQNISQNKAATQSDKQNVLTLIQQAIEQAKIATSLDPLDASNWQTLSHVYSALIGSADGAKDWTIAAFTQQVKTDPNNAQLRFDFANAYRNLGNDNMALRLYEQAAQLKPDFANAYFNMADIYKTRGDKQSEATMLEATLSLTTPDQPGYQEVKNRLGELNKTASDSPKLHTSP